MMKGALVLLVAGASCGRGPDPIAACKAALEAKRDAVVACGQAYARAASVETAKLVVNAHAVRGDEALSRLLALHPIDPIGAEVWHKRGFRLRDDDDDASMRAFERALVLRGGDLEGQVRELAALAERHAVRGDVREAFAIRAKALEAATKLGDPVVLAHVRVALAIALSLEGEEPAAEQALGDSIDHLPADDSYLPPALIELGGNHLMHGRTKLARAAFERVLTLSDPVAREDAVTNLIELALQVHDLDEAERLLAADSSTTAYHESFVARVAFARGHLDAASVTMQHVLAINKTPAMVPRYQTFLGEVLAKQGREAEAIAMLEHATEGFDAELANVGLDEVKQWLQRSTEHRAPYEQLFALYARSGRGLAALGVAQRATSRAYLDGLAAPPTPAGIDLGDVARAAGVRVEALHLVAESLRSSAAARIPDVSTLAQQLGDVTVWTYFVADEDVWLVTFQRGAAAVTRVGALAELEPLVSSTVALDEAALAQLGERLAPVESWQKLSPDTVLHIAADPPFDRVPFPALTFGGRRWIQHTAIAFAPNAAVLAALDRVHDNTGAIRVIGDPRDNLSGARAEATATAQRLGVAPVIGKAATRHAVLGAGRAAVLAVSSHADASPGGARLLLADGEITTAEIVDGRLAPSLVVLASCASAAVDVDAWGALAGAFLAAGSPNVIASRWALSDAASQQLIASFYDADGIAHPALGLARAQRAAIDRQVPVSAWAALVALGTGERRAKVSDERISGR